MEMKRGKGISAGNYYAEKDVHKYFKSLKRRMMYSGTWFDSIDKVNNMLEGKVIK